MGEKGKGILIRKPRENGTDVNLFRLCGQQIGRAMNWVDWLRTQAKADEQVLSGRRSVVMV